VLRLLRPVALRLGGDASYFHKSVLGGPQGEKIVDAILGRGMFKEEVARTFGVSLSSVKRYVHKAQRGEKEALQEWGKAPWGEGEQGNHLQDD
jgi:hypothetical protein